LLLGNTQNLLLDTDGNLKISDFGFSTLNIGDADGDGGARAELLHTTCGTPNYVAPEVLGKDGYDGKIGKCFVVVYPIIVSVHLPLLHHKLILSISRRLEHRRDLVRTARGLPALRREHHGGAVPEDQECRI